LFGWKMSDMPMEYTLIDTGKPPGGGLFKRPPEAPVGWSVYVGVADAAATLEKARSLGATVLKERTLIAPEWGHFAVMQDPTGAVICLHEAAPMPKKKARRPAKKARRPARKPARKTRRR
ncbi:MAG TPA: VOC family protein, partial [Anaeromyxobacteraceae bacterium]|nr:VOC family protein [Anaeromyxobacteraceae bacterium]